MKGPTAAAVTSPATAPFASQMARPRLGGRWWRWPLVCGAAAALAAGCFSARPPLIRSFSLAMPPPHAAGAQSGAGAPVVRVRALEPAPTVDRDLLVVRRSGVELELRPEWRWDERPHRVLAARLAAALLARGLASSAPRDLGEGRPTLELAGHLDAFEHDRSGERSVARVALRLEVRGFDDGVVRARAHAAAERPCAAEPAAAVQALSALADAAIDKALDALQQAGAFAPAPPAVPGPAPSAGPGPATAGPPTKE